MAKLWKLIRMTFKQVLLEHCVLWANTPALHGTVCVDSTFGRKQVTKCTAKHGCGTRAGGLSGRKCEYDWTYEWMNRRENRKRARDIAFFLPQKHKLLPAHAGFLRSLSYQRPRRAWRMNGALDWSNKLCLTYLWLCSRCHKCHNTKFGDQTWKTKSRSQMGTSSFCHQVLTSIILIPS